MDPITQRICTHFDEIGDREWERLTSTSRDRVSFELHRRLLAETISPGDRVLEIGAGPGRFTIELARLGAHVTVTDVSAVQLELNERHTTEAGCEHAVDARFLLDIRDVPTLGESTYDVLVAYGGPLSYVFEDAEDAFGHLLGVVRPGGTVLVSVMAALGSLRHFLSVAVDEIDQYGVDVYDHVIATGDLRAIGGTGTHTCRMFRWREIGSMIATQPCRLLVASASNCMSLGDPVAVERLEADPERWSWFMNWEASLCREPGLVDAGTHILFAVRRNP
jgi:2-polyprenyl-3-methyl-5-hydroxy-6-metoxy-1,4-benzoquinol methylase